MKKQLNKKEVFGPFYSPLQSPGDADWVKLLRGDPRGREVLEARLAPLPAHRAARFHHALASARAEIARRRRDLGEVELAHAVWNLEPRGGIGIGHGLLGVGRIVANAAANLDVGA